MDQFFADKNQDGVNRSSTHERQQQQQQEIQLSAANEQDHSFLHSLQNDATMANKLLGVPQGSDYMHTSKQQLLQSQQKFFIDSNFNKTFVKEWEEQQAAPSSVSGSSTDRQKKEMNKSKVIIKDDQQSTASVANRYLTYQNKYSKFNDFMKQKQVQVYLKYFMVVGVVLGVLIIITIAVFLISNAQYLLYLQNNQGLLNLRGRMTAPLLTLWGVVINSTTSLPRLPFQAKAKGAPTKKTQKTKRHGQTSGCTGPDSLALPGFGGRHPRARPSASCVPRGSMPPLVSANCRRHLAPLCCTAN